MTKRQALVETDEQRKYREVVEGIANNITTLAKAVTTLLNGPLKKRALVLLLASTSGQSQATVDKVLRALETLEADWLNR